MGLLAGLRPAFGLSLVWGFLEDCPERIGEDDPEGEASDKRKFVLETLKADCEVMAGRPAG